MHCDDHERARLLMDAARVAGLRPEEQSWLDRHLAGCMECEEFGQETARVLAGLNALSFEPDPAMSGRVRRAVALRARRNPWRRVAWAAAAAVILAAAPVYRNVTERQQARQDELLMERVGARIAQAVPEALAPLIGPGGVSQ